MAENESPNLLLDDLSPEGNTLSKVQGMPDDVPFGMIGSNTDEEYPFLTPEPKLCSQKHDFSVYTSETFLSSVSASSDISTKECSETVSSSSSSSDAESGTYEALQPKDINLDFDIDVMEDNVHITKDECKEDMLIEKKDVLYEELLEKVVHYEVELTLMKKDLQSSQEEIAKLKYENLTLVEELGGTIEKLRVSEENTGKMEKMLRNELEEHQIQFQVQLDLANQSIDLLQAELASERRLVSELQEKINKTTNDLNDYGREVEELKLALHDAQKDICKDRSQFQNDITYLNDQKDAVELRNKFLEEQVKQYENEKVESGKSQDARVANLLAEIKQLDLKLSQQCQLTESLNKNFDASKLKYDMLMVEKDEALAKVQTLLAELNARDTNMLQMEERINKFTIEHEDLLDESEKTKKLVEELRLKIADQENELGKQRVIICDRAEEKREVIRQLCFSLEYYRNGYQELCQAFMKNKRPAVLAA